MAKTTDDGQPFHNPVKEGLSTSVHADGERKSELGLKM